MRTNKYALVSIATVGCALAQAPPLYLQHRIPPLYFQENKPLLDLTFPPPKHLKQPDVKPKVAAAREKLLNTIRSRGQACSVPLTEIEIKNGPAFATRNIQPPDNGAAIRQLTPPAPPCVTEKSVE